MKLLFTVRLTFSSLRWNNVLFLFWLALLIVVDYHSVWIFYNCEALCPTQPSIASSLVILSKEINLAHILGVNFIINHWISVDYQNMAWSWLYNWLLTTCTIISIFQYCCLLSFTTYSLDPTLRCTANWSKHFWDLLFDISVRTWALLCTINQG